MRKLILLLILVVFFSSCSLFQKKQSVKTAQMKEWSDLLDFTTGIVTSDTSSKGLDLLWFVNIYPVNDTGVKLHRNRFYQFNDSTYKLVIYDLGTIDLQDASISSPVIDSGIGDIRGYVNHTYLTFDIDTTGMVTDIPVAFRLAGIAGDWNSDSISIEIEYIYNAK